MVAIVCKMNAERENDQSKKFSVLKIYERDGAKQKSAAFMVYDLAT